MAESISAGSITAQLRIDTVAYRVVGQQHEQLAALEAELATLRRPWDADDRRW